MTYKIISSSSKGNAVLINDVILIDCGVPYKLIEPYANKLALVLLTHIHGDHFREATVRHLARQRPALRWCCGPWMVQALAQAGVDLRRVDVLDMDLQPGNVYPYSIYGEIYTINPLTLTHDVPNCGYVICRLGAEKLFYATDTGTLDGISAPGCDLYLIECNHKEAEIEERAAEKEAQGVYAYERRAAANHLSLEQAIDWLAVNMGPKSLFVPLHQHAGGDAGAE